MFVCVCLHAFIWDLRKEGENEKKKMLGESEHVCMFPPFSENVQSAELIK